MGAFNPLTGKNASVSVGGSSMNFDKWSFATSSILPDVTNFGSGGNQALTTGVRKVDVALEGPYDEGNMAIAYDTLYTLSCSWNGSINLTASGYVSDLNSTQDVKDAGRIKVTFKSSGAFSVAIV